MLPLLPLVSFVFLFYITYAFIITPIFLSPLRHLPAAHPTARISSFWINLQRYCRRENAAIWGAHRRLGAIVLLGPNEVSVNCIQGGLKEVYANGMEKPPGRAGFYAFFENFGIPNMFSTPATRAHSTRKRLISATYSKTTLASSAALSAQTSHILYKRFLPALSATLSQTSQPPKLRPGVLNIYPLLSATTMDIVTAYLFGLRSSSNFLLDTAARDRFLGHYTSRHGFTFWDQEHPALTAWVARWLGIRLVPSFVDSANAEIEAWTLGMCDEAAKYLATSCTTSSEAKKVEDTPIVYAQLYTSLSSTKPTLDSTKGAEVEAEAHLVAASELLDHLAAGFDTSGITLLYIIHQLSLHPSLQHSLRAELLTLSPPLLPSSFSQTPNLPPPKEVDALPLLHAIIWETLRLHPAIPGPQPRVTPAGGCALGPKRVWVPGGVRVSASAGLLHREESVFEGAGEWRPERWLEKEGEEGKDRRREMDRWFWAFGSGGRMCVGSHLAVFQMKHILAALYTNFTTSIVDDTGIEQCDAYTAPPMSDTLLIKLEPVSVSAS